MKKQEPIEFELDRIPREHLIWLAWELGLTSRHRPGEIASLNMQELMSIKEPEFFRRDIDAAYRDGWEDGFDYAVECVQLLHRKRGFGRVREICNILWDWSDRVVQKWRYHGNGKHLSADGSESPSFEYESWMAIRSRIIRRDGRCLRCGSVDALQVDHIEEVRHGGLPEDDNLRVLCVTCHKSKKEWETSVWI